MIVDAFVTFLISASPAGEIKVAIPYGFIKELPATQIFLLAATGNLLVFPIVTVFFDNLHRQLVRFRFYKKFSWKVARLAHHKTSRTVRKYGFWGLLIFVGIPLPVTGAYIASIASWLFRMDRKSSFVAISIGAIVSTAILTFGLAVINLLGDF